MLLVSVTVYALLAVGIDGSAFRRPQDLVDDWEGIVGGVPAKLGEFSSQVSLQWRSRHMCGASILNKEWVLTAAHCVQEADVNDLSILAGTIDVGSTEGTRHPVSKIISHKEFNTTSFAIHDIAVLKVSVPFELDGFLRAPVKLPTPDQATPDEGAAATVIGWGRTSVWGPGSRELLKADVLIANQEKCKSVYNGEVQKSQICAGLPEGGHDSCFGDSGGPLFVEKTVVGLVSFGKPCALPDSPTVYTRVALYLNWIEENIAA